MARFSRLSGAILFQGNTGCYLIGHTKQPCSFELYGFEPQDPNRDPAVAIERLSQSGNPDVQWPDDNITFTVDGYSDEQIMMTLSEIFLVKRNNMVSERIWNLITEESERTHKQQSGQWILDAPEIIWDVIRDFLLRC